MVNKQNINSISPLLSIVIVSMDNSKDLIISLDSIIKYNSKLSYEIIVVLYKYSETVQKEFINNYNTVKFIVSHSQFRGFSENNNLGLKVANGKYCLILNDDTYFLDNSIEQLVEYLESHNSVIIVSPHIKYFSGKSQIYGRPRMNLLTIWFTAFGLEKFLNNIFDEDENSFKTYGISGSCFLIRHDFFKRIGYFDENYFFIPEDLAVSEEVLNIRNYPHVLKDATVYHKGNSSGFKLYPILNVVARIGTLHFFKRYKGKFSKNIYFLFIVIITVIKLMYWIFNIQNFKTLKRSIFIKSNLNVLKYINTKLSSKELFIYLFNHEKRGE